MSWKYSLEFKPYQDACDGEHGCEGGVEFFIAGGDAAEGFEACKEVLNTVALAIEMLVKSGFGSTIGFVVRGSFDIDETYIEISKNGRHYSIRK